MLAMAGRDASVDDAGGGAKDGVVKDGGDVNMGGDDIAGADEVRFENEML